MGRSVHYLAALCVVSTALAACSSSGGGGGVNAAQAQVTAKQKALDSAKAELSAKSDAFCTSSQSYITALDRYGDIINQTAATVGDVKSAGSDLQQPRQQVMSSAQAVQAAQQDVADATNELAQAKNDLKVAQANASGKPSPTKPPATTASAQQVVSDAVANRVKQADADFTNAQKSITDQTKLTDASERFNAAVVALEIAWLQLFADAGCLTDQQEQQAAAAVHDYTVALQRSLKDAGYYSGNLDGVYGPSTVAAVEALQKAHHLPVTGTLDKASADALDQDLQAKGGVAAKDEVASTAAVQQTLKLVGFWDGPVDGNWTSELTDALKAFQKELGVPQSGEVDSATVKAFERAVAKAKTAISSSSAPATTPSPPASSPASTAPAPSTTSS